MKKNSIIKILGLMILFLITLCINNKVLGANAKISVPSTVYVGDKITVKVTGNAASWSNLTLKASGQISGSGGIMADSTASGENENVTMGTYTFTATSVGSATFTLSGLVVNSDYTKNSASDSKTIQIIKKEEQKKETTPTNDTTTKKQTTTNTKPATTTKVETKTEEKKEDNFYISSITLKGIKENGEQIDINLSPEFNKDTYEYTCNIASDIQKIDLQKDAGEYTNSVIVTGLDELKEGENIIKLVLSAEEHESKTYTIKVIKEKQEIVETVAQVEEKIEQKEEGKQEIMVSMPLWVFIVMQIIIIIIEVLIIYFVPWKNLFKIKNKNIDIDE